MILDEYNSSMGILLEINSLGTKGLKIGDIIQEYRLKELVQSIDTELDIKNYFNSLNLIISYQGLSIINYDLSRLHTKGEIYNIIFYSGTGIMNKTFMLSLQDETLVGVIRHSGKEIFRLPILEIDEFSTELYFNTIIKRYDIDVPYDVLIKILKLCILSYGNGLYIKYIDLYNFYKIVDKATTVLEHLLGSGIITHEKLNG